MDTKQLLETLVQQQALSKAEWHALLTQRFAIDTEWLFSEAVRVRELHYGRTVYLRGLIEISNYCVKDCLYCGIRRSSGATRYRLDKATILACCAHGYATGLRTFVLQGGEDAAYTDADMCEIVASIKAQHPDCAVTLSLGEKRFESYAALFEAGADRYLLRHETADAAHYASLHPHGLTLETRMRCLQDLKKIGYQVGCGLMVGSPNQTAETLTEDFWFMQHFQPHMVGIGPFLPHHDTPFAQKAGGTAEETLILLALTRLLLPKVLLPATTALGTARKDGWERGMLAGANVIMPNLTPAAQRQFYLLYDNKNGTSIDEKTLIEQRMAKIGFDVVMSRGDHVSKRCAASEEGSTL